MKWDKIPRIKLANLPTKLEPMKKLTEILDGPQLLIKRDDETGLAFGGNKVRKLEFIIADALAKKADIVITSGAVQTNHGRLTAAATVKAGLKPVLVLTNEEPDKYEGNLLVDYLLGAEIHFVGVEHADFKERHRQSRIKGEEKVAELKAHYESLGKKVFVVPRGGRSIQGTLGYVLGSLEIYEQIICSQTKLDYIVTGVGSTSTFGGLILGNKLFNTGIKIIGISVSRKAEEIKDLIIEQVEETIEHFGLNVQISREEILVHDAYVGDGYAVPTAAGIEAIKLLGKTESVFLDHIYTGKAMAGLIDLVKRGYFTNEDSVAFLHTGGNPALFSLDEKILGNR